MVGKKQDKEKGLGVPPCYIFEEPSPWPIRPLPLRDESMASWLCRLAEANGVSLGTLYDSILPGQRPVFDPDQTPPPGFLEGLAIRATVTLDKLQAMTLDPMTPILSRWKSRRAKGVFRWKCSTPGVRRCVKNQFCPFCLRKEEIPYFRLRWRLSFVTVCDVHRVALWDFCPACHGELDLQAVQKMDPQGSGPAIVFCRNCGTDLRHAAAQIISPGEAETQILVDSARRHQTILLGSLRAALSALQKGNPAEAHLMFESLRKVVNKMIDPGAIKSLGEIVRSEWPLAVGLPDFTGLDSKKFDELPALERMVIMGITDWDVPGMGGGFLTVKGNQAKLPIIIHAYWKKRHHELFFDMTRSTVKPPENRQ